jgi:hypothetical protein
MRYRYPAAVPWWDRSWALPLTIFVLCTGVYSATAGERLTRPSPNNHYVHLANAWLRGRLDLGPDAPGTNDWACFDTVERRACPSGRYRFSHIDPERYRWYVSFPPLPAVLLLPAVAVFGLSTLDALLWVLLGGLAPALLFVGLRALRESGRSARSVGDDLLLTAIFAVGSVYYFVAVQGTVWFAAHVVAAAFACLYLWASFGARRPAVAGLSLGLAFLCRPATLLLGVFFLVEAIGTKPRDFRPLVRKLVFFAAPVLVLVGLAMWHNAARFDDPFEFGHRFLQVRWRTRIETWGLFSTHYLRRNLAVFFLSLPWWLGQSPFVRISRHGLALWFTTPNLLWALVPKKVDFTIAGLWAAVLTTATCTLLYQNTGWVQFGYRFSLDYLPLLIVLVALSGRSFGRMFWALAVFSTLVNAFGAVTFDRYPRFYDTDPTQTVIFQPD